MDLNRKKNYGTEAIVNPHRFVKFGTASGMVIQAAAATDGIVGISDELGAETSGDRIDVVKEGQTLLELGDTCTRGTLGTADSVGRGIPAAPAQGANARYGCIFEESGVVGDIVPVTIVLGIMQGA